MNVQKCTRAAVLIPSFPSGRGRKRRPMDILKNELRPMDISTRMEGNGHHRVGRNKFGCKQASADNQESPSCNQKTDCVGVRDHYGSQYYHVRDLHDGRTEVHKTHQISITRLCGKWLQSCTDSRRDNMVHLKQQSTVWLISWRGDHSF